MRFFRSLLMSSALLWAATVAAQDSTRYLFGEKMRVSGTGGLLLQAGQVNAHDGMHMQMGGGGGLLLARRLLIGAYSMGIASHTERVFRTDTADWKADLAMDHSGLLLQYALSPEKPAHPFFGLQLGWGQAQWNYDANGAKDTNDDGQPDVPPSEEDRVFVITPSAGMQLNITHWFRPDIYVGWRIVDGVDLPGTAPSDLNGFFFGLNALFGGMGD